MIKKGIALLLIIVAVYWSFSALLPQEISNLDTPNHQFSTQRALVHLKELSKEQHHVGSEAHQTVRAYIIAELEKLGLETQVQEAFAVGESLDLVKAKNILARIKGSESSKALLLLTHYDSEPHSSYGASDAGSGVVTILEGVRAFLSKGVQPKNDIIILFTDAEELGLNGASIFVNQHEWAKDVGLALNFEARGSGGPSYMLIETNQGNANLMKAFVKANPQYPVATSLAYSIYKMLPNDTDLTRFREDGDINGFNFAFIDDHYDYHTALDTCERLDRNSLEHQGSYLMPLLSYFSEADLTQLKSKEDYIYFNVPIFKTVIYPFSWIMPMLLISILVFIVLIIYGFKKERLQAAEIGKGFIAFFGSFVVSGVFAFFGWKLIKIIYPHYAEMLQGFTYNGHTYIWFFVLLSVAICLCIYHRYFKLENVPSLLIAPLFLWLAICAAIAFKLKGASFFIIPVLFGLLSLFVLIRQKQPNIMLLALLCFPTLMILSPFVKMFPVGLGLGILFVSAILVTLIFGLLVPVFGFFKHKKRWSYVLFFLSFCFLVSAHFKSKFSDVRPKPNSLVYMLDADNNKAIWATYDEVLDAWTHNFIKPELSSTTNSQGHTFASKYSSGFIYENEAPLKAIKTPKIEITHDTILGEFRQLEICVTPQRKADRIEVFSDKESKFNSIVVNGVNLNKDKSEAFLPGRTGRMFSYYVSDEEPLDIVIGIPKEQETELLFLEASYDLLSNDLFTIPERESSMIPKPFVLNDVVIVKKMVTIK